MKVPIRMKNKQVSKIYLNPTGQMAIEGVKSTSDSASKGISAQPAGPLTELENKGNPGLPPSQTTPNLSEQSTGAPTERVSPEKKPEADKQPGMKELEQAPVQAQAKSTEQELSTSGSLPPAPHTMHPAATSKNVLQTETAEDAEIRKAGEDASTSTGGDAAPLISVDLDHDVEY